MVKHCGFFDLAYVKYLICYGGLVFLCRDNHLTFCFTGEVGLKFLHGFSFSNAGVTIEK
jgi:hypothetical protein